MIDENKPYDCEDGSEYRCEERGLYSVLDHGYLRVIETWGSDRRIIESARMSTDKGFLGWGHYRQCRRCSEVSAVDVAGSPSHPGGCHSEVDAAGVSIGMHDWRDVPNGDAGLLRYLYEHKHSTPFEFAGLTIEVQAPIMVYREWHRHRTQSYSEMSARYVQMPNLHYVPSVRRIIDSAKKSANKQASGKGALSIPDEIADDEEVASRVRHLIRAEQQRIYTLYETLLSFGISKEVARIDTPVARYSRMRATANLRNWLAFLTLRMDSMAQFEIRQYAWCVACVIADEFPRTYELFCEGRERTG